MIKKWCGNDVTCICEVVACNLCTDSDRWKYVSGSSKSGKRFLCRSHTLVLIFVEVGWFEVGYGIDITEQFVQMLEKKQNQRETLTSLIIVFSLFTIYSRRFCTIT